MELHFKQIRSSSVYSIKYVMSIVTIDLYALSLIFRVALPTPGQSYDCHGASESMLKDMGK